MKGLSAGLTFFNLATVSALLLGIVASGLGPMTAGVSLALGFAGAVAAYFTTTDLGWDVSGRGEAPTRYRWMPFWLLAAIFAFFAVRSFCWLLYIDGDQLMIQSPNNLGDLALHITYIKDFANGTPLWPPNPIYPKGSLRYPAGADLFNGLLCVARVELIVGLVWVGLLASLATFYAFFRWGGVFTIAGFLFNGGVAGFVFLTTGSLIDYQGDKTIAWKSLPLSMFVTQRGLLYAIPAGLLLLWQWRERYFRKADAPPPLPFGLSFRFTPQCRSFMSTPSSRFPSCSSASFSWAILPCAANSLTLVVRRFFARDIFRLVDHRSLSRWLHHGLAPRLGHEGSRLRSILVHPLLVGQLWDLRAARACSFRILRLARLENESSSGRSVPEDVAFLLPCFTDHCAGSPR